MSKEVNDKECGWIGCHRTDAKWVRSRQSMLCTLQYFACPEHAKLVEC